MPDVNDELAASRLQAPTAPGDLDWLTICQAGCSALQLATWGWRGVWRCDKGSALQKLRRGLSGGVKGAQALSRFCL